MYDSGKNVPNMICSMEKNTELCDIKAINVTCAAENTDNEAKPNFNFNCTQTTDKLKIMSDNSLSSTKSKLLSKIGLNFLPGSKLEAKDFNEKWYSARVVETDWIEREVLIHFDKWSSRFDEWIPMDSSRLRMLQIHPKSNAKLKEFNVGERILATWIDGKKYPAKIKALLGNDKYDILFDDGYSKVLKSSKITKLIELSMNKHENPNSYLGSKQERRDKKRKHTVTELFHTHSKKKIKNDSEQVHKKKDLHNQKVEFINSNDVKTELHNSNDNYQNIVHSNRPKKQLDHKWIEMMHSADDNVTNYMEEDYTTFIGNLRVEIEDSTYKCPKTGCGKNFRKENLLQMHIKHYHPEYSKFLGSTPNVADLAYARTIGESIDDLIPKKPKVHNMQFPRNIHYPDAESSQTDINSSFETETNAGANEDTVEQNCSMSPGALFDMHFKEDKGHIGIKVLPPVRQILTGIDVDEKLDYSREMKKFSKMHKRKPTSRCLVMDKIDKQMDMSTYEKCYNYSKSITDNDNSLNYKYISNLKDITHLETTSNLEHSINFKSTTENNELVKVEKLRREEIINCTCGITEEDGLMIQCDLCLCWQHGHCNAIEKELDVPEKYICYICQHAHHQRISKMYIHDQDWIREGKLPSICDKSMIDTFKLNERIAMIKRSYDLIYILLQLQNLLSSLRIKVNIAQSKDHPKLYLWAKSWSKLNIPILKNESIPILRITKANNISCNYKESDNEVRQSLNSNKSDFESKLITSDTELMKILEEDSSTHVINTNIVEESKPLTKYCITHSYKDERQILLDALTKYENEKQNKQNLLKKENNNVPKQYNYTWMKNNKLQEGIKTSIILTPTVPIPEAPIDSVECKLRLLEHINNYQNHVDSCLNYLEIQLDTLDDVNSIEKENFKHTQTKQVMQMLLNDLQLIRKLAMYY